MRARTTLALAGCTVCGLAAIAAKGAAGDATGQPSARQELHPITKLELVLKTGNRDGAGTDGDVFLGVAGREFFVDSSGDHNDFERNATRTYVFGAGANVQRASENDPRSPWPLDYDALPRTPRYVRFEPGSDWDVERIELTISATNSADVTTTALDGNPHLWLGEKRGKIIYLR